jgi:hypothetical protein
MAFGSPPGPRAHAALTPCNALGGGATGGTTAFGVGQRHGAGNAGLGGEHVAHAPAAFQALRELRRSSVR